MGLKNCNGHLFGGGGWGGCRSIGEVLGAAGVPTSVKGLRQAHRQQLLAFARARRDRSPLTVEGYGEERTRGNRSLEKKQQQNFRVRRRYCRHHAGHEGLEIPMPLLP